MPITSHEGVVKLLLERRDVDSDRPDVNGWTPLVCAAEGGHEGVMKLLLNRGENDFDPGDRIDRTPLGCASTINTPVKRKKEQEGKEEEGKAKRMRGEEGKAGGG